MIYPQKISSKKVDRFTKIFRYIVFALSIVLLIINYLTTPHIYWSHLCVVGFIYIYFTVRYSITQTRNIAGYVVFQTILIAALMYFIDYRIGYSGWSVRISIPILVIIANIAMLILTIISYKDYGKYAFSQLIMVLLSISVIYFLHKGDTKANPLVKTSISISVYNFLVSLILCHRDLKEEIIRKLNI